MAKRSALGKGLGALLGDDFNDLRPPVGYIEQQEETTGANDTGNSRNAAPSPEGSAICEIPLSQIEPNPFQPRKTFDDKALEELAQSIRHLGLIQPVTLRKIATDKYQIISGERRFRACKAAGMTTIPAYIRSTDDTGMLEMAIVENLQRKDLDPIEIAVSFRRLIEECNLTQEEMAQKVGKGRASITNYLRLLKLSATVQHSLKTGRITVGHAKVLLGVEDLEIQSALCEEITVSDLSVRQLEARIRKLSRKSTPDNGEMTDLPEPHMRVLERFGKYFGDRISLKRNENGKGTMTIHFDSDEEIERFLRAIEEKNI